MICDAPTCEREAVTFATGTDYDGEPFADLPLCGSCGGYIAEAGQGRVTFAADPSGERRKLRYYCGCYVGPPLPPEGEQAECGWETIIEADAEEYAEGIVPAVICGGCGATLGNDDVTTDGLPSGERTHGGGA